MDKPRFLVSTRRQIASMSPEMSAARTVPAKTTSPDHLPILSILYSQDAKLPFLNILRRS